MDMGLVTRGTQHEAFNAPDIAIGIEFASGRFRRSAADGGRYREGPMLSSCSGWALGLSVMVSFLNPKALCKRYARVEARKCKPLSRTMLARRRKNPTRPRVCRRRDEAVRKTGRWWGETLSSRGNAPEALLFRAGFLFVRHSFLRLARRLGVPLRARFAFRRLAFPAFLRRGRFLDHHFRRIHPLEKSNSRRVAFACS